MAAERVERGIRRLPSGSYEVRVHVSRDPLTRRPRQISRTVAGGIRAARTARSKLETEVAEGKHGGTRSTLGYLLDEWNAHRERIGRANSTLGADRRRIDTTIRPALGAVPLAKLSAAHIDRFYGDQLAGGTTPASLRKHHAILHAALQQGVRWGWLPSNPAHLVTVPASPRAAGTVPVPADVHRLITEAERGRSPHIAGIVMFGALSGLRRGELCGLRFEDVDWDASTVTVHRSIWQATGQTGIKDPKTHQVRTLAVDEPALEVLRRRRDRHVQAAAAAEVDPSTSAYVWSRDQLGADYLLPNTVTAAFGRVRDRAGLTDVRLHDLRHFAGTEMVAAGVNIRTVADRLGHADPAITLRVYAAGRQERDREAASVLGRALAAAKVPENPQAE